MFSNNSTILLIRKNFYDVSELIRRPLNATGQPYQITNVTEKINFGKYIMFGYLRTGLTNTGANLKYVYDVNINEQIHAYINT